MFYTYFQEYLKPVATSGTDDELIVAKATLYNVLDTGLRLINPFMPFISEELFQRLPRKSCWEPPSLCVSSYPEVESYPWRDLALEADFEFVQKIVHAIRSAKADYNMPQKAKTEGTFFINN